jgi:adenosylcobinamide-GDP ribazoletransferase
MLPRISSFPPGKEDGSLAEERAMAYGTGGDPSHSWNAWVGARAHDLSVSVLFCTRLPLARSRPFADGEIARAAWAFPLAGVVVGIIGAVIYVVAARAGVPPWPAAALAVAATLIVTGALHEDGLADTADGFGGATRDTKLAMMRDSRIGTYGVCALILSFLLRVGAIASLADPAAVAAALIGANAAARALPPLLMFFLPPARNDGLSHAAGAPTRETAAAGAALGFLILLGCVGFAPAAVTAIVLAIVFAIVTRLSAAQIGGQTGDVCGAVEQVGEIAVLVVASTAA